MLMRASAVVYDNAGNSSLEGTEIKFLAEDDQSIILIDSERIGPKFALPAMLQVMHLWLQRGIQESLDGLMDNSDIPLRVTNSVCCVSKQIAQDPDGKVQHLGWSEEQRRRRYLQSRRMQNAACRAARHTWAGQSAITKKASVSEWRGPGLRVPVSKQRHHPFRQGRYNMAAVTGSS
jgi:hypothetical protein